MRRSLSISLSFLFISLSISCAGKFDGEIDGDKVPSFTSALFAQTQKGNDTVGVIEAFSFAVDCDRVSSWFVNRVHAQGETKSAAIADLQESDDALAMPAGAWRTEIQVVGAIGLDGDFSLGARSDQIAQLILVHQRDLPDENAAVNDGLDPNADTFLASAGDFSVDNFDENSSVRLTGTDVVFGKVGGQNPDAGDGTMTVSATFCNALSDDLVAEFSQFVGGDVADPRGGEGEGGVVQGGACSSSDECPNIVCICDDGTDLGNPVNTQNCDNGNCDTADVACPSSCDSFGESWTGTVDDGSTNNNNNGGSTPGETGDCSANLGAGDGCDCGCGAFDADCGDLSSAVCDADHCVTGSADPNDNSQCTNG